MANTPETYDPEKTRRLLLNKKEIAELADAESKKGLTIVPLEVYNAGRLVKLRLAIVKGKGQEDRREDLKRQTDMREAERDARGKR
jgi:SsrA-binding protein